MYILDPKSGKGRRALIKDKAVSLAHKNGERIARAGRHIRNRVKGVAHEVVPASRAKG